MTTTIAKTNGVGVENTGSENGIYMVVIYLAQLHSVGIVMSTMSININIKF